MMLEFYGDGQPRVPPKFDAFLHLDGSTSYCRSDVPSKHVMRIIVELNGKRTSVLQKNAIFGLISKHRMCTVAFYGVDN